ATGVPRSSALRARHGATLTRVLRQIDDVRRVSPISLELAYVASGVLDGCFELELALWDTAAGVLLVREAGGIVSDWDGDPDAWSQSGAVLVASTPLLHRTLLAATRRGDGAGTLLSKG